MVPFAGYAMPVSVPAGHPGRAPALPRLRRCCSTSRTWASCGSPATTPPRRSRRWCRSTSSAWRVGKQRYALLHQRRRRHPRRPDGDAARRRPVPGRQRRLQGRRHRAPARPHRPPAARSSRCPTARCSRCRGRRPSPCWRGWRPSVDELTFMTGGACDDRTASPASSPAPATPAKTASRSRSPGPRPKRSRARCWPQPEVAAGRPGRARHAAARGRPVPLRPRHRRDDHAGRGRPHLGDPEGAPPGRRARRRLSGRGRRSQRSSRDGAPTQAGRPGRPRARAGARGRAPRRRRRRGRSAGSPAARSARASTSRSRWRYVPAALAVAGTAGPCRRARQAPADAGLPPCRSCRTATSAADPSPASSPIQEPPMTVKYTEDHEWIDFDDAGAATVGITPACAGRARRRRLRRPARGRQDLRARATSPAWSSR